MTPTEIVASESFIRCGGRCECSLTACGHVGRCTKPLHWEQRGSAWDIYPLDEPDRDNSLAYLVLCADCLATWRG